MELMGHQKMVGLVIEVVLPGKGFLLIDSLDSEGRAGFRRYVSSDRLTHSSCQSFETKSSGTIKDQMRQKQVYKRICEDRGDPNDDEEF